MAATVELGGRPVGSDHPAYVIAEIGINHNGDLDIARQLIDEAARAGCDAVKFQKRTPRVCVPEDQWDVRRDTPWGEMSYLEYKERMEFTAAEYEKIDGYARDQGVDWFVSPWDVPSVEFAEQFDPPCHKIASACITDFELLDRVAQTGRPVMMSTGMSTMEEIEAAIERLDGSPLLVAHSTSSYPCPPSELNLRMIPTLSERFPDVPIGYSGHEVGLQTSVAAVALGATFVERHITLDRAMWGTDQAASVEPPGMARLVRDIRVVEDATGDGVKRVYDREVPMRAKLRRVQSN